MRGLFLFSLFCFIKVFQAQFYDSVDKNQDGKATFDEVKDYLAKYSPVIKDSEVEKFIARRDVNGNSYYDSIPFSKKHNPYIPLFISFIF